VISEKDIEKALKTAEKTLKRRPYVDRLKNPFKVVVSTLLSARTKDETTAIVSERLFSKVKTPKTLLKLTQNELEHLVYPVSFYKNKARFLFGLSRMILEDYGGKVPKTIEELIKLPGVGRKTANLVISVAFGKKGVCVDTHVHRILNRWGTVSTQSPLETEMAIRRLIPSKLWSKINRILVPYGKETCTPLSPYCASCRLNQICSKRGVEKFR